MARQSGECSRVRIAFHELVVTRRSDVAIILDDVSLYYVLLKNPARACLVDARIPYVLRIDHHHWTMTTLIHAPCMIDSHLSLESGSGSAFLEDGMNGGRAIEWTGFSAGAYEYMALVLTHRRKMDTHSPG